MNEFYLNPDAVVFLCQIVLALAFTTYLFTVREKSAATWWLAASMAGHSLFLTSAFLLATSPATWALVLAGFQLAFLLVALSAAVGFAYTFLGNVYSREAKWVVGVAGAATVVWSALYFASLRIEDLRFTMQSSITYFVFLFSAAAFQAHVRKTVRLSEPRSGRLFWRTRSFFRPSSRPARAHRAFSVLSIVTLLLAAAVALRDAGVITQETGNTILLVGFLGYVFAAVIIYVNHAPEPTTFQVKVIGLALATGVAVLGLTTVVVYEPEDLARASDVQVPRETVRFERSPEGGYRVVGGGAPFDDELVETIEMENGGTPAAAIGFEFPFAGMHWDSLHVDDDGLVSFGGGFRPLAEFETTSLPMIAPYFVPLQYDEGGKVYVKRDSAEFIVTWYEAHNPLAGDAATLQLALDAGGGIEFRYGHIPPSVVEAQRGIYPSGAEGPRVEIAPADALPAALPAGTALAQSYRDAYRQFVHNRIKRMVWLIFGSTIFILVVFPFLLSSSITRPLRQLLDGVRRVNKGDLEAKVPVTVRDELGDLADNFNRMTLSLQHAEERLRTYAQELEKRVEERTAELRTSLDELKATQTQLVQQEKLASLGALTAGIAHEIKNPLNFVNNFAALSVELADELAAEVSRLDARIGDEDADELQAIVDDLKLNAEKIAEHGKRADGIVKSMLLHSRGSSGERQETDLNSLLNEYVNLAFHGMRAQDPQFNCDIQRNYDDAVGAVEIIPQDVGRVFINLLNNAFYAVAEKAKTMNGVYAPVVCVSTRRVDDAVNIVVKDNGSGIPESVRKRIFEPFFTTKPTGSGTGLGLSLSHEIVTREHGGSMHVESEEGEATTFTISLPTRSNRTKPSTP